MAYSIFLTDTAKRQLAKLDKQVAKRIVDKLHQVAIEPFLYVSKLTGQDLYKLRVGDYRVLMTIQQDKLIIIVIEVSHRLPGYTLRMI